MSLRTQPYSQHGTEHGPSSWGVTGRPCARVMGTRGVPLTLPAGFATTASLWGRQAQGTARQGRREGDARTLPGLRDARAELGLGPLQRGSCLRSGSDQSVPRQIRKCHQNARERGLAGCAPPGWKDPSIYCLRSMPLTSRCTPGRPAA